MGRSTFISILAVFTIACGSCSGGESGTDLGTSPDTSASADMSLDQEVSDDMSTSDMMSLDFDDIDVDMVGRDMPDMAQDMVDMAMPLPSIQVAAAVSVAEGGGALDAMVRLTEPPAADVQVSFAMHPDIEPATVTIPAAQWQLFHPLSIEATDDLIAELDETVVLELTALDVEPADLEVTITDNDVAEIIVTRNFLGQTWSFDREAFEVYLATPPQLPVAVEFWPTSDDHYVAPMALRFDAQNWDVPQTVTVGVDHDSFEDLTGADLGLTAVTEDPAYALVTPPQVTTAFFDDDFFTRVIGAEFSSPIVRENNAMSAFPTTFAVDLQADGLLLVDLRSSAPQRLTLTPSRYESVVGRVSVVEVPDDSLVQPPELVAVTFGVAANGGFTAPGTKRAPRYVWVIDDDAPRMHVLGDTLEVNERHAPRACTTVVITTPPASDVVVDFGSANTSELEPINSPLIFDSTNWWEPQRACIRAIDDDLPDGDQNVMLVFGSTSVDAGYDALQQMVSVRVTDDETPGYTYYRRRPHVVGEGPMRWSFDTLLFLNTLPVDPVTMSFGLPANVFSVNAARLPGAWYPLAVRPVEDEVVSGLEYRTLDNMPMTTDADYAGLVAPGFDIIRIDADQPNDIVVSDDNLVMARGQSETTAFSLRSAPTGTITIPLAPYDPTLFTISPAILTFDATNWDVPQTVTVTAIDDLTPGRLTWLTAGPATGPGFAGKYALPIQLQRN